MQRMDRLPPSRLGADAVSHGPLCQMRSGQNFGTVESSLNPRATDRKAPNFDPRWMIPPGRPQICNHETRSSARSEPLVGRVEHRWMCYTFNL